MNARVLLGCLLLAQPAAAQQDRLAWLGQHSVPLRTVAADATDFSDLERWFPCWLACVLQLAELSHGDGHGSAARVRLIRFLHERLGFNVVVWEADACAPAHGGLRPAIQWWHACSASAASAIAGVVRPSRPAFARCAARFAG